MNLWIPHQKKEGARHTMQPYCRVLRHVPCLNHWQITLLFHFNYSHVLSVKHHYVQRIVRATCPQSINVGGMVRKLLTISVMQGQQC